MGWHDFPIQVEPARCLTTRTPKAACRRCQEVCPADAISLDVHTRDIRLDDANCLGCGICLTACPTGVFDLPGEALRRRAGQTWEDILRRMAGRSHDGRLSLSCAYAQAPADVSLPCLGLLNDDSLLALNLQSITKLSLLTADCQTCPLHESPLIEEALAGVRARRPDALAVEWQITPPRESLELWTSLETLLYPPEPAMDRRGFLKMLTQPAKMVLDESAETTPLSENAVSSQDTALPATRLALLHVLEDQGDVAFPRYVIGPACDDCQDAEAVCVTLCPTSALRHESTPEGAQITFAPTQCVDCSLCVTICPQEAIQRAPMAPGHAPLILRTFQAVRCRRCGKETLVARDGLCPACQREEERRQMWLDFVQPAQ